MPFGKYQLCIQYHSRTIAMFSWCVSVGKPKEKWLIKTRQHQNVSSSVVSNIIITMSGNADIKSIISTASIPTRRITIVQWYVCQQAVRSPTNQSQPVLKNAELSPYSWLWLISFSFCICSFCTQQYKHSVWNGKMQVAGNLIVCESFKYY